MFIKVHTNQSEKEGYSKELCNSVHFSYSLLNDKFNPLNKEYGILFAEGFIDSNNTIIQRSVCRPCIFRIPSYGYGIAAIFCDNLTPGAIAYWYSKDLITFSSMLTLQLKSNENVFAVNISFDLQNKRYEVEWQNEDGITFINYFNDYHSFLDLTSPFIISAG